MKPRSVFLSLFIIALIVALLPFAGNRLARRHVLAETSRARVLFIAMQAAAGDRQQANMGGGSVSQNGARSTLPSIQALEKRDYLPKQPAGPGVAYPFESGLRSTAAYLDALEKGNYLSAQDRAACRDLVVANVSENDPPETVVILSRNAYEAVQAGQTPRSFLVFRKNGDGAAYKLGDPSFFKLPPRQPAVLEP